MEITAVILIAFGLIILLGFGTFGLTSLREREQRAAGMGFAAAVVLSVPFLLSVLLPDPVQLAVLGVAAFSVVGATILFLLPIGRVERGEDIPKRRIDERDIMFARADLEPGSRNYETYYTLRPENRASDDKTRALPGLLSPNASEANRLVFDATHATFDMIKTLHVDADRPATSEETRVAPSAITDYIKGLATYWGAHTVGVTELKPYHVYTHIGRGHDQYGASINLEHRYAIAFTVEMDHAMVSTAPAAPTLLESSRQYANAAQIAIQLANFIRSQGYPARAHIDGNYRVVAPLVARDAGLGEIGRMGLLMTPTLGPRVRLSAVTTNLPLISDPRTDEPSVLDFCQVCEKCADNCPVRAIPYGDRHEIDGALRWRINQDICYRYWCVTGTDCARCMAVCPYSYPAGLVHNLVRWSVRRSGAARRAVIWMDRISYGSTPAPKPAPSWVPPQASGKGTFQKVSGSRATESKASTRSNT
ncbi:MAG TPA: reductive dehalogenase domain-containing protein [Anaerolineae bacterium]|nr:reductive dehalogenase domain-containing protein [Anaerolineae bacterium]